MITVESSRWDDNNKTWLIHRTIPVDQCVVDEIQEYYRNRQQVKECYRHIVREDSKVAVTYMSAISDIVGFLEAIRAKE